MALSSRQQVVKKVSISTPHPHIVFFYVKFTNCEELNRDAQTQKRNPRNMGGRLHELDTTDPIRTLALTYKL